MPSTYTNLLRLIDQANGENEYTWGDLCDTNFQLIEDSIAGLHTENITGSSDHTLTTANGADDEARNMIIQTTGVVSGNLSVIVPARSKMYVLLADHTGAFTVTVTTGSGTGTTIEPGDRMIVICDGTNVTKVANVASTTDSTRIFQPGMEQAWAGAIADIPAGWLFANGAAVSRTTYAALFGAIGTIHGSGNGTTTFNIPDRRDVVMIGARQDDSGIPKTNITGSLTASGGAYAATTGAGGDHSHGGSTGTYALLTADLPAHTHAVGTLSMSAGGTHTHTVQAKSASVNDGSVSALRVAGLAVGLSSSPDTYTTPSSEGSHTHTITGATASAGSDTGHSHTITASGTHTHTVSLPPYKTTVWMIKI